MARKNSRGGLSRRDWLRCSALGVAGASASGWFERLVARAGETAANGRAYKSCILLYMSGGPGQMFTFNPLPGGYAPISTAVPGIQICESLPELSKQTQHLAILRSMSTSQGAHRPAVIEMHTGFRATAGIDYPTYGSIISKEIGDPDFALPNFVLCGDGRTKWASNPGHLGPQYVATQVREAGKGLEDLNLARQSSDVRQRVDLIGQLDADFLARYGRDSIAMHRNGYESVVRLMDSPKSAAFDLEQEPAASRSRYGTGEFADRCLLARRLVEVGVPFVEVSMPDWDTHSKAAEAHKALTAELDRPMATLIADLAERGMLDSTLVVWMGEFGRAPGNGGGHYPRAWTTVLAGAGIKAGQVIGRTDAKGGTVEDTPISAGDFSATILHALGIDHTTPYEGPSGQPIPKVDKGGQPVAALFG